MHTKDFSQLESFYRNQLLDDVVPFWLKYSLDKEFGGYLTLLDQDGSVYGTDKYMWAQGRETWLFAKLYNTVEKRGSSPILVVIHKNFIIKG